jgi:2',3'-cyclic-nucleotide 2'-phosphodiesterase (5'-nucleotidase family)
LDFYRDMGYTALCVGKRDLAGSTMFLLEETKKRGLRPLSSNLRYKGKAVFVPYGIFEVNGTKVGVLAVTSPQLSQQIKADGVEVLDPSARLKSLVPELKNRVDVIILLSNLSEFEDRKLPSTVDGIDIIIESGRGKQRYQPLKVGSTYLLRGNIKGRSVGKVTVKLDSEGGIQGLDNELHQLKARLPVDEAAIRKIRELKQKYSSHKAVVTKPRFTKNPFLEAIEEAKKRKGQEVQTNATVSNPFIELLKKRSKTQGDPSKSNPFSQKSAPEVKEPESAPEN